MELQQKIEEKLPAGVEFGIAVEHIESGETAQIRGEQPFPTASVFKVPVMVEVYRQARAGRFNLNDRLILKDCDRTLTTGVLLNLQEGLQPTIRDLVMLMIIVSDNVATTMLMDLVGAENVTNSMHALGFSSMSIVMTVHEMFLHAFGIPNQHAISLDDLRRTAREVEMDYTSRTFSRDSDNNVSSAIEMTRLMAMIHQGQVVDREACDEMLEIMTNQQYNNRVTRYMPWRSAAHKTGTMRGLRNDSGILTCGEASHAAFTVFSFDSTPLDQGDRRFQAAKAEEVERSMAEIGLIIHQHFQDR